METPYESDSINETQSLQIIREMIQVSQKKLKNDGILFILWGWLMVADRMIILLQRKMILIHQLQEFLTYLDSALIIAGLVYTVFYVYKNSKMIQTYIGISLRYVWISMFVCMVLINLIQFNVLHSINFELQHPIFMIIISFALVTTGGILRFKIITFGGVFFGLMALFASYYSLSTQLLIEIAALIVAFIVPGHILYSSRKK